MPSERVNAIKRTREFLRSLLDPKATPRIPKAVREQAYWCLKHFPQDYDVKEVLVSERPVSARRTRK